MTIREKMWQQFARLCARPHVRAWLINQATKHPFGHLDEYMKRYTLIPFTVHLFGREWELPFSARVHHILREDLDKNLHHHPWDHRSIVLMGWYTEEDQYGDFIGMNAGDTKARRAETLHRIDNVSDDGVWTLFIMGRWRQRWGFMTPMDGTARIVYYRDYLGLGPKETSADVTRPQQIDASKQNPADRMIVEKSQAAARDFSRRRIDPTRDAVPNYEA